MVDCVGKRNLTQRLAGVHPLQRLARLVRRQLARPAEQHAVGLGAGAKAADFAELSTPMF